MLSTFPHFPLRSTLCDCSRFLLLIFCPIFSRSNWVNHKLLFIHRMTLNFSEETSFFNGNSPLLASPSPCPISPCHSDSSPLAMMDDDIIDFESFVNEKPYSPARKKLNMDSVAASASLPKSTNFHCLRELDENLLTFRISMTPTRVCKRLCEDAISPHDSKRLRSENSSPQVVNMSIFSLQTPPIHRKPVSIMSVLTSSSELLRKNRLWGWNHPRLRAEIRQ